MITSLKLTFEINMCQKRETKNLFNPEFISIPLPTKAGSCHVFRNGDQGDHKHRPQPKCPIVEYLIHSLGHWRRLSKRTSNFPSDIFAKKIFCKNQTTKRSSTTFTARSWSWRALPSLGRLESSGLHHSHPRSSHPLHKPGLCCWCRL